MSYFTNPQDSALKQVLETIVKDNDKPELVKLIQENNLLEAVNKDANIELVLEDVEVNAENNNYSLTDEQIRDVAYVVIDRYDESDYNHFIDETIQKELNK